VAVAVHRGRRDRGWYGAAALSISAALQELAILSSTSGTVY
jgi:hypothetical protein